MLNISRTTVYRWAREFPEFKDRLDEARFIQAESFIDEIVDIADNEDIEVARAALRIRARKNLAEYRKPKEKKEIIEQNNNVFLGLSVVPPKEVEYDSSNVVEQKGKRLLPQPKRK